MIFLATAVGIGATYVPKIIIDLIETGNVDPKEIWQTVGLLAILYILINPLWRLSGIFGSICAE